MTLGFTKHFCKESHSSLVRIPSNLHSISSFRQMYKKKKITLNRDIKYCGGNADFLSKSLYRLHLERLLLRLEGKQRDRSWGASFHLPHDYLGTAEAAAQDSRGNPCVALMVCFLSMRTHSLFSPHIATQTVTGRAISLTSSGPGPQCLE